MTLIQFRRGTAADWTTANPELASGEFGYETDTRRFKIGPGNWNSLNYMAEDLVDADLASRSITFTDEGGGQGHFSVGGVPVSGTLVPPAATWSGVAGRPSTIATGVAGNGSTDDRAALATSDDAALAASLPLMLLPGTYKVSSNITIDSPVWFAGDAILKPDNGVTVTLAGGVAQAPMSQIFDHSAGGVVAPANTAWYHPQWWGAVGDSTTDDGAALVAVLDAAGANGGASIAIEGATYATTEALILPSFTTVAGGGTIKCLQDAPGGRGIIVVPDNGAHDIRWDGPTIDGNFTTNANCIGAGAHNDNYAYHERIYIDCTVKNARIDTSLEDSNNLLYSGGGKGYSIQGRCRNIYARIVAINCDVGATIEAGTTDERWMPNCQLDLISDGSRRTALYLIGSTPLGYGTTVGASFEHGHMPGCRVNLVAYGGNTESIVDITDDVSKPNYELAGVITSTFATGVDVNAHVAVESRATVLRGKMFGSRMKINALMDDLEDVWDARVIAGAGTVGANCLDNVVEIDVHAQTHHGVLIQPPDSGELRRSRVDVNTWIENGVGDIMASGTEFDESVTYAFRDYGNAAVGPVEVIGKGSSALEPAWAMSAYGDKILRIGTMTGHSQPTIDTDLYDQFNITAQASNITSMTNNLSGTPQDGQTLRIRFTGTNTRTITWGASFAGNLLATTSGTNTHVQELVYDAVAAKWIGTYHDATGY